MYKQQIQREISKALKEGVNFGASGRDGSDNSYEALQRTKENIDYLKRKQGI